MLAELLAAIIEAALPSLVAGIVLRVVSVIALHRLRKDIERFHTEREER